jgi:riboflavin transporter FmnP
MLVFASCSVVVSLARVESRAFKISIVALMLALTAVFEFINRALPLRVPWGMSIDFVALPIIITFFILGTRYSLLTAVGMFFTLIIIGFAGFVGAVMKFSATIPMVLVLGGFALTPLKNKDIPGLTYRSIAKFILAAALAIVARCAVATLINYYWAIPLFFSMPMEQVIQSFFFGSIWGFVSFVSAMNVTQGVIDLAVAWIVVFGFGLAKQFLMPKVPQSALNKQSLG